MNLLLVARNECAETSSLHPTLTLTKEIVMKKALLFFVSGLFLAPFPPGALRRENWILAPCHAIPEKFTGRLGKSANLARFFTVHRLRRLSGSKEKLTFHVCLIYRESILQSSFERHSSMKSRALSIPGMQSSSVHMSSRGTSTNPLSNIRG